MSIKVYAPASIGNFSVGFDLLGAAVAPIDDTLLGDVVEVSSHDSGRFDHIGNFSNQLPPAFEDNIIHYCLELFNQKLIDNNKTIENLHIILHKNLPVGSGLGSSASSIVAALHALNLWYQEPLPQNELLEIMGLCEARISGSLHYDNIAPSFKGGLQLVSNDSDICNPLPFPGNWYLIVANPGIHLSTKAAREILPQSIDNKTAIEFSGLLSNFIRALYDKEYSVAASYVKDVIAEPFRKNLLPDFDQHKFEVQNLGALSFGISGSGSTLFAIADSLEDAERINHYLDSKYCITELAFSHICKVDFIGSRRLNHYNCL